MSNIEENLRLELIELPNEQLAHLAKLICFDAEGSASTPGHNHTGLNPAAVRAASIVMDAKDAKVAELARLSLRWIHKRAPYGESTSTVELKVNGEEVV